MAPFSSNEAGAFYSIDGESSTTISSSSSRTPLTLLGEESMRKRRSVSFSPDAAVHVDAVMNLADYSPAEKCECWYQADEMQAIRREVKETVALMNQDLPVGTPDSRTLLSTHGLEGKTKVGKRHRKEIRLASLAAVFDEQSLQEMDGVCDPIMIARAYSEYTYPMLVAAFQRASFYQKEAAAMNQTMTEEESDDRFSSPIADTSRSVVAESTGASTKSDPEEYPSTPQREKIEDEKTEAAPESALSLVSNEMAVDTINNNNNIIDNNIDDIENLENGDGDNHPYNVGSLRIRDRFACLLPGSASNGTRSLIGAFRVVQI